MIQQAPPRITYREYDPVEKIEGKEIYPPRPLFVPSRHKVKPGEDDFVVLNARKQRRQARANRRHEMQRHQKAYVRRELRKEREANSLAQFFNLNDRLVPAAPLVRNRAHNAILARVRFIRDQDQKRYDKEWKARQKNRDLPAPKPVISHDEVLGQLRAVAKTARIVTPKVKVATTTESLLRGPRDFAGGVTIGRTGRAG